MLRAYPTGRTATDCITAIQELHGRKKTTHHFSLLGSWLRSNVVNGIGTGDYLVGVCVGDLEGELFLEGHDDFHGVQAV